MSFKVWVTLGFHINFYHSWRGDTPDEAGFGTDMRVIRRVLEMLNAANARGLQARGYWDTEVYWTFQEILPRHCPDILEGIRARVRAGLDEIILGPFNNGANHAATADEFRAAVAWAIDNPWNSGLRQLFGRVAPYYRPQEMMVTTGQEDLFRACGVEGLLLYYAGVPFNTLAAFVPTLSLEQRYNPLTLRLRPGGTPLLLLPCISTADLLEHVSLENLMLDLHARQQRGEIRSDVLIHLNADADLETWIPVGVPRALAWFPNTGGLEEYIRVVNKYPWAEFTVPSEYVAAHPPRGEVLVRQDLADGGFDGNYSWAEKCPSLHAWTLLERSRLASLRADALAARAGLDLRADLWDGMDSSFFQRLIGLSTTHFGMSTPVINEERQARAFAILGRAAQVAERAERRAARALKSAASADDSLLYEVELFDTPAARDLPPSGGRAAVRLPVVLPRGVEAVRVEDQAGEGVRASLTDVQALPDGRLVGTLRFVSAPGPGRRYRLRPASRGAPPVPLLRRLANPWLEVAFSEEHGIQTLRLGDGEMGGADFLRPFVTYRVQRAPRAFFPERYRIESLPGETWDGLQRVRLRAEIPMRTRDGDFATQLTFTFTLFDVLPYLFVDVQVAYAYTPPREVIHNMIQKLRRLTDLRWVEVAPFQITPRLEGRLRVWKHNYLGITSSYDLDYGEVNPRNREWDAFNHQVTAGWVAVTDGQRGLLVGECAEALASMAFCPMRLREEDGRQVLSLNPFGSYYGRLPDYSHLGGSGVGARFLTAFSGALNPNGPSYNGQTLRFALMLAPYSGDEPPAQIQADAGAHFYPPGVLVHRAPRGIEADTANDLRRWIADEERRGRIASVQTLLPPTALLANPGPGAADLVWDAPRGAPVTGYEVEWRLAGEHAWKRERLGEATRWHLEGLEDGRAVTFRLRALCGEVRSEWTAECGCVPGAVTGTSVGGMLTRVPVGALVRLALGGLRAAIRAAVSRR